MYIAPNSTIALLRGVPLDKRYADTLYFASDSAQHDYFYSKRKMVFTAEMYQRYDQGRCRIKTSKILHTVINGFMRLLIN